MGHKASVRGEGERWVGEKWSCGGRGEHPFRIYEVHILTYDARQYTLSGRVDSISYVWYDVGGVVVTRIVYLV